MDSNGQFPRHIFQYLIFLFCIFSMPAYAMEMTLEEKVGQLLMVHFRGETANEEAKTLVQEIGIGGVIYYNWANGLHSSKQVQNLSLSLQNLAQDSRHSLPLFIAIDQEGGAVSRLTNGFAVLSSNRALGEIGLPDLAEEAAYIAGQELKAVGININLAPVIDINNNPRNPVIGNRSFGDKPEIVTVFGAKALRGYKRANILACLKHFPGHGDVELDSHIDLPVIHKSIDALKANELFPFAKLAASAELIMTGHLLVPAFDPENCSTLSEKTLNYLRNEIGFDGIIITDSLVMEGVLKKHRTVEETAIQALIAGCDILLLGGKHLTDENTCLELNLNDLRRIHSAIVEAVKCQRVSEERLNQAVQKIFKLKSSYFLIP